MNMINQRVPTYQFRSKRDDLICVRHITPNDAALLVDIFAHMSAQSRYRRFNQMTENVTFSRVWQEAEQIVNTDPAKDCSLIAFTDRPQLGTLPIGAARFVGTDAETAEVAISLRDDFQNQGIGTELIALLAEEARRMGYRRLIANIQNENVAMWRVFLKLPYRVTRAPEDRYASVVIDLDAPRDPATSP